MPPAPPSSSAICTTGEAPSRPLHDDAHLYRDMFENAVWGIFQTTGDGHYLNANPALARIYGYSSPRDMLASLTNIERQLYVDPNRRADFVRLMKEHASISGFESEIYRRNGDVIWITETCREVRGSDGALLYYEGTVEDITARKTAEQELRLAKINAESASRAKSTFLANISHELRTPLNAVLGFSEIIRDEILGPVGDARYVEYARNIHSSGSHLLDVINDILDTTKIESGKMELHEEIVDVQEIMKSCRGLVSETARQGKVRLEFHEPGGTVLLLADGKRLRQILLNLLSNALKFTPPGGTVTFGSQQIPSGFVFEVTDTGIGMDPEQIRSALEPFQQIDNSMTRRYEGTGLGLPIVRSLMELHGGRLTIASMPGTGTCVRVLFPPQRISGSPNAGAI